MILGGENMAPYLTILKDILVVLSPIIVACISYKSNKKNSKDIKLEIEKILKEKDAETSQILQKINAELESKKQLASWNNSWPQTEKYTELAGIERYGNICSLTKLIDCINEYINNVSLSVEELNEIKTLLGKINLPLDEEILYAYEIPYIIDYKHLIRNIDTLIQKSENNNQN